MKLRRVLILALLLLPAALTAWALTTAQLQTLGQQYAAQYGVPWNVFQQQIQAESGWNPNIACNGSGACGIAQILGSTAANPGYGIAPVDPSDPAASLQFAAQYDAALFAANGNSWVAALTAYSGGCSLANPCNAAYALALADAQGVDQGGGGGGGVAGGGPAGAGNPAAPPNHGPSATAMPYQWIYGQLIDGMIGGLQQNITASQNMIRGLYLFLVTMLCIAYAYNAMKGALPSALFWTFILRTVFVWAFIQPNSIFYQNWVVNLVTSLPGFFAQYFNPSSASGAGPAQIFDGSMNAVWAYCLAVWHTTPFDSGKILVALVIASAMGATLYTLSVLFVVYLGATFLALLVTSIGPVIITAALFPKLDKWLSGYIDVLATLALLMLLIDALISIFDNAIIRWISQWVPTGSPDTDSGGLFGIAVVLGIMGYTVHKYASPVVQRIGGGVSLGFDRAHNALAGPARLAASGAFRFAF